MSDVITPGLIHASRSRRILTLHDDTSRFRSSTLRSRSHSCSLSNILKHLLTQLSRNGRALSIFVYAHFLRDSQAFLWHDALAQNTRRLLLLCPFLPEISLQPNNDYGQALACIKMPIHSILPIRLQRVETLAVRHIVAKNEHVWSEEGIVLRAGGIVEFEAVRAVVHADVEDEGLVAVAELREHAIVGRAATETEATDETG